MMNKPVYFRGRMIMCGVGLHNNDWNFCECTIQHYDCHCMWRQDCESVHVCVHMHVCACLHVSGLKYPIVIAQWLSNGLGSLDIEWGGGGGGGGGGVPSNVLANYSAPSDDQRRSLLLIVPRPSMPVVQLKNWRCRRPEV